ncbi:hypothetical protein TNCV_3267021 [Trichonephila clavipes]|nr:hypothetical protein TNCV_3267021 [Trichonephila clavipes]
MARLQANTTKFLRLCVPNRVRTTGYCFSAIALLRCSLVRSSFMLFTLCTDASKYGYGVTLLQELEKMGNTI